MRESRWAWLDIKVSLLAIGINFNIKNHSCMKFLGHHHIPTLKTFICSFGHFSKKNKMHHCPSALQSRVNWFLSALTTLQLAALNVQNVKIFQGQERRKGFACCKKSPKVVDTFFCCNNRKITNFYTAAKHFYEFIKINISCSINIMCSSGHRGVIQTAQM